MLTRQRAVSCPGGPLHLFAAPLFLLFENIAGGVGAGPHFTVRVGAGPHFTVRVRAGPHFNLLFGAGPHLILPAQASSDEAFRIR